MSTSAGVSSDAEPVATILMVDDRAANLLALEAILEPLGHRLVKAQSGEEALKCLLDSDFACILMDVQMPGLDGFQTAALIKDRQRSRHIPIIFLTAINKESSYVFKGYEHGAVDYMLKPFDPAVLRSKVNVFTELFLRGERLKRSEAKLRAREREVHEKRSEERYRSLLNSMSSCVWAARPDGDVYYWNQAWLDYSGLTAEQSRQRGFLEQIHEDDREPLRMSWIEAIRDGKPFEAECRLRRSDGVWRWHLVRAVAQLHENKQISGWIITSTDIDDLKRAREQADLMSRTKDEFLATVSHELRNPLNAILGWVRMLGSGKLDEIKERRALETIERNTEAQLELVEDILDVSRIITGKLRMDFRPLKLTQVLTAAVDTVRPAADAKGIELVAILDGAPEQVSGDPDRLQQVVWNLLANAIKFTPKGGRVEARVERHDSYVDIRVVDTGRGIDPEFLPFLFERFRQADPSSTRTQGGLGLGLAIVRHLVELHGGTVEARSAGTGKGATFVVRLPLRAVQADTIEAEEIAPRPRDRSSLDDAPALDGLHVLVVDDEPDARELLQLVLGECGAQVTAVGSSEEAVRTVETATFDVIVSDVGLPLEDGYTLIRRIRALGGQYSRIPAAALTGFARAEDGQRALAAGFQVHVPKPVEPGALVSLVAHLAGRGRKRAVGC
jgi:PAS domain S-box-containing protein